MPRLRSVSGIDLHVVSKSGVSVRINGSSGSVDIDPDLADEVIKMMQGKVALIVEEVPVIAKKAEQAVASDAQAANKTVKKSKFFQGVEKAVEEVESVVGNVEKAVVSEIDKLEGKEANT